MRFALLGVRLREGYSICVIGYGEPKVEPTVGHIPPGVLGGGAG